jgi:hypothetical protein
VGAVARRLGLCTATIYSLCARGELAHVRILNANCMSLITPSMGVLRNLVSPWSATHQEPAVQRRD